MRCLFNRGPYARQIASRELIELHRHESRRQDGSKAIVVYYGYAPGLWVLTLHWFEDATGAIGASGRKDPKYLYVQGDNVRYHLHAGNSPADFVRREPERRFRSIRLRLLCGTWRRLKCRLFGPIEAHRRLRELRLRVEETPMGGA